MKHVTTSLIAMSIALAHLGCDIPTAEYEYGDNVLGLEFKLYSETTGVHPNTDVLLDPNNPFRESGVGRETKWDIQSDGGNVAAFYSWSTVLASEPSGESQFYAASRLSDIFFTREGQEEQREQIRLTAIAGFQSMLDHFPNAVTYDITGTIAYRLAHPAIVAIKTLGGSVRGDWIVVVDADGTPDAIPGPRAEITAQYPDLEVADDE